MPLEDPVNRELELPNLDDVKLVPSGVEPDEPEVEASDGAPEPEDKQFKNPHARARILEGERDRAERDQQILAQRLQYVLDSLPQIVSQSVQAAVPPKEETPEVELDPLTILLKEVKDIKGRLDQTQGQIVATSQAGQDVQALNTANQLINNAIQSNPEFKEAVVHISRVMMYDLDDKYPNLTDAEKYKLADDAIQKEKIRMIRSGKNPADEFYKKAKILGFTYNPETVVADKPAKDNPKNKIQAEKEKHDRMNSIGGAPSTASGRKIDTKALAEMSEEDFNNYVDAKVKDGTFKVAPGRRTPNIGQLLRGSENPTRAREPDNGSEHNHYRLRR